MTIRVSRGAALRIGCAAALAVAVRPSPSDAQLTPVRFAASPAGSQAEAYFAQQLGFFQQAGISMTQTFVTRGPELTQHPTQPNASAATAGPLR